MLAIVNVLPIIVNDETCDADSLSSQVIYSLNDLMVGQVLP
jgi:hypothetical protein